MAKIDEAIRRAIDGCGKSRYELAKLTGISEGTLSRFVNGRTSSLSLDTLERLAGHIGIELRVVSTLRRVRQAKGEHHAPNATKRNPRKRSKD